MYFVNELVEVVFVAGAQIDEGLYGLIRVGRDFLTLTGFDGLDSVVGEQSEISDAVVYVCRLVNADQRFIEDGEEVPEKLQSSGLDRVSFHRPIL